jgi:hypothetical protein
MLHHRKHPTNRVDDSRGKFEYACVAIGYPLVNAKVQVRRRGCRKGRVGHIAHVLGVVNSAKRQLPVRNRVLGGWCIKDTNDLRINNTLSQVIICVW